MTHQRSKPDVRASRLERLVMWLFPGEIDRLRKLDEVKRQAELTAYKWSMLHRTNFGEGGKEYSRKYHELAREFEGLRHWWIKPLPMLIPDCGCSNPVHDCYEAGNCKVREKLRAKSHN